MSSDLMWIKVSKAGATSDHDLTNSGVLMNMTAEAMFIPVTPGIDYVIENMSGHEIQVAHAGRLFVVEDCQAQKFCNDMATLSRKPDDPVAVDVSTLPKSAPPTRNSSFYFDFESGKSGQELIDAAGQGIFRHFLDLMVGKKR